SIGDRCQPKGSFWLFRAGGICPGNEGCRPHPAIAGHSRVPRGIVTAVICPAEIVVSRANRRSERGLSHADGVAPERATGPPCAEACAGADRVETRGAAHHFSAG